MIKILLAFTDQGLKPDFVNALSELEKIKITISDYGEKALELIKNNIYDLAAVEETLPDMTGIEFVEKLVMINPMMNTAIASDLPEEDFHEATEGLGVLMAIPSAAGKKEALYLIDYLAKIMSVTIK
jgi:response regulator RpfG family c-di-GMP phosphodiesterase